MPAVTDQLDQPDLRPFPDDWERALVVMAHPDDMEYGGSAAVAALDRRPASTSPTCWSPKARRASTRWSRPSRRRCARPSSGRRPRWSASTSWSSSTTPTARIEYGLPLRRDLAAAIRTPPARAAWWRSTTARRTPATTSTWPTTGSSGQADDRRRARRRQPVGVPRAGRGRMAASGGVRHLAVRRLARRPPHAGRRHRRPSTWASSRCGSTLAYLAGLGDPDPEAFLRGAAEATAARFGGRPGGHLRAARRLSGLRTRVGSPSMAHRGRRGRWPSSTGGASGIGLALARRLLEDGRGVVVVADRRRGRSRRRRGASDGARTRSGCWPCRPTWGDPDRPSTRWPPPTRRDRFGAAHVLCNNAGVAASTAGRGRSRPRRWRKIVDVNLMGVRQRHALVRPRHDRPGRGPRGQHGLARAGLVTGPGMAPYFATKHERRWRSRGASTSTCRSIGLGEAVARVGRCAPSCGAHRPRRPASDPARRVGQAHRCRAAGRSAVATGTRSPWPSIAGGRRACRPCSTGRFWRDHPRQHARATPSSAWATMARGRPAHAPLDGRRHRPAGGRPVGRQADVSGGEGAAMASARAMRRRALSTCRFSIMRPLYGDHALARRRSASSKAAMSARASSTRPRLRAPTPVAGSTWLGWMSVLPSKPIWRPCTHSASKPVGVLDVVVDAVEDHLAGGPGGEQAQRRGR